MLTPPRRWRGWSGCCAEQLSWCGRLSMPRVPGRLGRCRRWALTWPPTRHGTCYRMPLRRIDTQDADTALHGLRARVGELVWEANSGVDA
jgi:hypothetical protein